jgi:predicted PurR-regulated permease PerM
MDDANTTKDRGTVYWTPRRAAVATLVVSTVAGFVLLAGHFRHIIILVLLAIVLATALKPAVEWLNRHGVRWALAVNVLFAVMFLALLAVAVFAGPTLVREGGEFFANLPQKYSEFRSQLRAAHPVGNNLADALPSQWPDLISVPEGNAGDATNETASSSPGRIALQVTLAVVIVFILSAYWLLQEQRTIQAIIMAVPRPRRAETKSLIEAIDQKVGAYVRGQLLLCVIVGVMSLVGYWLIGLSQPMLLAGIAGLFEAIPMLGPVIGAVPALLVAAATDPSKIVGVLAVTIVIQQVENYLLVPRIMDRAVGIHAFVTLLAMIAFGALFGILGAILAIPLAAIVQLIVDRYVLNRENLEPPQPEGRDRVSRLRFELQSLIQDVRRLVRHKSTGKEVHSDSLEEAIEAMALELDQSLVGDEALKESAEATTEEAVCAANKS